MPRNRITRDTLAARAEELKNKINYFMTNGKEFAEVKIVYQEFKEVLSQLRKFDVNHRVIPVNHRR
jgi:hypothetical protein